MANERLRAVLFERGMSPEELAEAAGVDAKTVERWIGGRAPYRKTRFRVATVLGVDELYLWPDALTPKQAADSSRSEIIAVHPHRWAVPREGWRRLFESAEAEIGVLVYAGFFLADDAGMVRLFREKAQNGVRIRLLLGDPDSEGVRRRGDDEGIGDSMAGKIHNALVLYRPLLAEPNVEVRLHDTILYNSIYRADEQLLVNTHVYGAPAADAPVLHLRKISGGDMANTYLESFERVWAAAKPLE